MRYRISHTFASSRKGILRQQRDRERHQTAAHRDRILRTRWYLFRRVGSQQEGQIQLYFYRRRHHPCCACLISNRSCQKVPTFRQIAAQLQPRRTSFTSRAFCPRLILIGHYGLFLSTHLSNSNQTIGLESSQSSQLVRLGSSKPTSGRPLKICSTMS